MQKAEFFRNNIKALLIWPAIAVLLGIVLWGFTLSRLNHEEAVVRENAYQTAKLRTSAYAEQVTRTIERIDQAIMLVKYEWQKTGGAVRLEEYYANGVFPTDLFHVSVANRNGDVVTSTLSLPAPLNFADRDWFQLQKSGRAQGLVVQEREVGPRTGRTIIRFSRRMETADGAFAGVAWVTVEPPFLTTLYEGRQLGKGEFISLRLQNGPVLATKAGGEAGPATIFYKQNPVFVESEGIIKEPGQKFRDNESRIVAWKKLDPYPLVVLSALTDKEVFASYRVTAEDARNFAVTGSLLLLALAMVGTYYSARLAWRNQQDAETKSIFRLAVDGAREGFYMVRPLLDKSDRLIDFQIADCNERGAALMDSTKEQLVNKKYSELYSGEHFKQKFDFFKHGLEAGFYEDEIRNPSSSLFKAAWVHRRLVRSGAGLAMTIRDISETKAHEQALIAIANADALTGLPNRHWLNGYLPSAIEHAKNYHIGLAILFIDLDNFKNINDTLGHAAGDELLKAAAKRLKSLVRAGDHVVRLGGDEFTIVLEQVQKLEDVSHVADLVIQSLSKPFTLDKASGNHVHASIGISLFPQDGDNAQTLLKHADIAMYAAKASGKGRYHFYQSHLSDHIILRVNKEEALRRAIERDEFVLHYQPRVDTFTGRLCSMEALIRWMHPERGLVPPVEFIEVAEDTGLILKIGEQVIAKACAQLAVWKAQGQPLVPISINVSALQFNEGRVKEILASYMKRHNIDPALIGIELTESCMVADSTAVPEQLNAIRALGVKLLVDDFGTGYSSLSQLQRLDVDILKVDRAFTRQLNESDEGKAFFKAIVSMADALGICIVAEGVETAEQLRILQALSCSEIQGYLVSEPVPAADVPALMHKRFLFPHAATANHAPLSRISN
jgi:diguanylate cyclase (GGDEF)-like protein